MPDFQYVARSVSGQQVTGVLSAATEQEALQTLSGRSLYPVRIGQQVQAESITTRYRKRKVKSRQLSTFYSQLADLLQSGVPLLRSLELLEARSAQPALKQIVREVREAVADGTSLAEAFADHQSTFGELAVSMVRAGEEGAFLEDVLKRIADFTDYQEELKSKVVGALVYPIFLIVVGFSVVTILMTFLVPKFMPIFATIEKKGQLPWATTALIGVSNTLQNNWWILAIVIVGAIVVAQRWLATDAGRLTFDGFRIKAPVVGPIVKNLAISRFCRILGTLLKNGVPILLSLRIAKDATGNKVLSTAIGDAAENISEGKSLAGPLSAGGHFSDEVVAMITVGEEANNLEQVLINIADSLERRTNRQLELFVRMIEPILLLFMALIVLFIVIAILLPILRSSNAI